MKKMDVMLEVNQSGVSPTFLHICFQFISSFLPLPDLYLLFFMAIFYGFLKTSEETMKFLFLSSITNVCLFLPSPLDCFVNVLFQ